MLFSVIKYLWMLNMSRFIIEFKSTEKSYTFSFEDTSLDSVALKPSNLRPRENWARRFTFLLTALNLKIYFPLANK